ncbi:hypothetical protein PENSUB_522 [Penicillium subrubescens]|uniref:Uncharacterized protein n=1 Tax=Penicillium subrubescens TaxID=1316194 RepID=A0A1Q5UMW3_9EURO|nr:hypothetical protein PENSUB_522 [Penicillium subrubescens]
MWDLTLSNIAQVRCAPDVAAFRKLGNDAGYTLPVSIEPNSNSTIAVYLQKMYVPSFGSWRYRPG